MEIFLSERNMNQNEILKKIKLQNESNKVNNMDGSNLE